MSDVHPLPFGQNREAGAIRQ